MPIAILAGGLGTRVSEISPGNPKSMIEICGKPFVYWQISRLIQQGYSEIVMCLGHKGLIIQEYVEFEFNGKACISYSFDGEQQLGTGGSIKNALPLLGDKFMVLYGDSYLPLHFSEVEAAFFSNFRPALMTVYKNSISISENNALIEGDYVIKYSKSSGQEIFTHIDYGLNVLTKEVFDSRPENSEFDLGVILSQLSSEKLLACYEVNERFYEIGSPNGIMNFEEYLKGKINEL
jgi:NDP-sugar pyrophosphorylase family protein